MKNQLQVIHQLNLRLAGNQQKVQHLEKQLRQARAEIAQTRFELENAVCQFKAK